MPQYISHKDGIKTPLSNVTSCTFKTQDSLVIMYSIKLS